MSTVFTSLRIRSFLELARGSRRRVTIALAMVLAALLLLLVSLSPWRAHRPGDIVVRRGTLQPVVPLVGVLAAERSDAYGAVVPGVELKILWLVPEGTLVRAGDRLIQFDPAPFQRDLDASQGRARELEAETDQARLALVALRLRSRSAMREAEDAASSTDQELEAFVNSGAPLSASESAHDVEQKRRLLQEAEEKLAGIEPFVARGFISQEEYRAAQVRREQAAADLQLAMARHSALVHQTNPDLIRRKLQESRSGKQQLDLGRQRARAEIEGAEAALRLATVRLELAWHQVEDARNKIAACGVTASGPGLTVHSEFFDKAGERRKVRTGDSVWGGTTVVTLPDLSKMVAEGRVSESEIQHLSAGQAVRLRLDAFPDLALAGVLQSIGSVGSSERGEARTFPVRVAVDQSDPKFRPGMIARCVIEGQSVGDALVIPIDVVGADEKGTYVLVRSLLGGTSRRAIVTGRSTSQSVEVRQGLREGETLAVGGE